MEPELEPPPSWPCFADEVAAVMSQHPEYDLEDAIEALIWGMEEENEDQ
jgi:hypothetical protein